MGKIKFCAQLGFALAILLLLQALLIPKYMESTQEGALIGEYYANAGGNDVIFIGDCEVYENFSPITLWNEYGIPSCIRGSPQQTIWQSYYLLEETLRYETPQVVVFNVLSMKYDTPESTGDPTRREAYNRLTLDSMRPSVFKWKAVQASLTADERAQDAQFSYLFPILRFHDRWSKLTAEDFTYWLKKDQVSHNGYLMQTGIKPMTDAHPAPVPAGYQFGSASWDYLNRMERLCREHGIRLVLIKAPTLYPVWWKEWDAQIRSYAQEKGLLYLNMTESLDEIGIDWSTDTYDAGLHLNVWGAEKAAFWFGRILATQCGLPDRRDDDALCARWPQKRTSMSNKSRRNWRLLPERRFNMRNICVLLLIVCTVLWICGCSAPAPQPTESGFALPAESGFVLTVADCTITMGAEAAPILAALGKPVTVTEEASCAFDGTEKTYCYEHFCLTTCPVNGAEIVCRVWFTDDSLSTAEGIRIGSSRDAVAQTYGGDVFKDDGLCVLNRGESSLTILLTNGAVTSVQYALIIK